MTLKDVKANPKLAEMALVTYQVPVTRALEDAEVKKTTVWRLS